MAKSDTIRGLERGLRVLEALQANPISALQDIHAITQIPKPSLLRILNTLERAGLVSRRLGDGRYRISTNMTRLARKRDRYEPVAEAAAPVLDLLCQKVSWPSDLMVPAGDHMEIRETSRTHSPFMTFFTQDRIGTSVNWLTSGVGRAYLAFCPDSERQRILAQLRKSKEPEDWLAHHPKRLERIYEEIRAKGYATRDPAHVGGRYRRPTADGLASINIPLLDGSRVHGSINILWVKQARTFESMVKNHLADLQTAAAEIVASLRNYPKRR
jgi:IclR family transcriptional regulator, mhp operon transcriptional activator